jgi:hypothetical protein
MVKTIPAFRPPIPVIQLKVAGIMAEQVADLFWNNRPECSGMGGRLKADFTNPGISTAETCLLAVRHPA